MTDKSMPPMPFRFDLVTRGDKQVPVWSQDDMLAYGRACADAAIERCAVAPAQPTAKLEEAHCSCNVDIRLHAYSVGADPAGLYGRVWLDVEGEIVEYMPAAQPTLERLTREQIWALPEMRGWFPHDHYRIEAVVRAIERERLKQGTREHGA